MKTLLFYFLPLAVYAGVNNWVQEELTWPYYLILLFAFLLFQLGRLRYPKNALPKAAKVTQAVFYALAVMMIFRDQFLDAGLVNLMIVLATVFVVVELFVTKPQSNTIS